MRFDKGDFAFQPRTAGSYFPGIGFFMQPPLAARRWFPFEMLYRIGYVGFRAIDANFRQSPIE